MRKLRYLTGCLLLAATTPLYANEGYVTMGFEYGASRFNLESDFEQEFDPELIDITGLSGTYSIAYRWHNNVIVEGNLSYSGNAFFTFGLSDFYEVSEAKLLAGYSFSLHENIRIVPMVGLSRWDTRLQESALLNPGPEARIDEDGTDFSYKLSLEFPFESGFVVSLSHAQTRLDLGDVRLNQVGLKYEF